MNDLISRQAAIDALMPIYKSASLRNRNVFSTARKCMATIKDLPSAQPEPCEDAVSRSEIIRLILERGLYCDTQADREISADIIRQLPSVKPKIIRCKDCAKREYCRTSTVWAVAPSDDWYCADAERRTDG